eukprot:TRINITY_DN1304_c0_g2_i2.p1 TRINITY_DN1304_c0_g2~~TRINITY_DN1304_c0_g2_i2.p1  ORF type:complete len:179 (+),score=49.11 TRINITY_DN1304_c0_g2_i2:93-629(+)
MSALIVECDKEFDVRGTCYCGGVKYKITKAPSIRGYCHCSDCRMAHSAPLYQSAYVYDGGFEVIEGQEYDQENVKEVKVEGLYSNNRHFCRLCGTRLYNKLIIIEDGKEHIFYGTFPNNYLIAKTDLENNLPEEFKPTKSVFFKECALKNLDWKKLGLPIFNTMPERENNNINNEESN